MHLENVLRVAIALMIITSKNAENGQKRQKFTNTPKMPTLLIKLLPKASSEPGGQTPVLALLSLLRNSNRAGLTFCQAASNNPEWQISHILI